MKCCLLNPDHTYRIVPVEEWMHAPDHQRWARVALDDCVSTVFLGAIAGPSGPFESLCAQLDIIQRYDTWEEALDGHRELVLRCQEATA